MVISHETLLSFSSHSIVIRLFTAHCPLDFGPWTSLLHRPACLCEARAGRFRPRGIVPGHREFHRTGRLPRLNKSKSRFNRAGTDFKEDLAESMKTSGIDLSKSPLFELWKEAGRVIVVGYYHTYASCHRVVIKSFQGRIDMSPSFRRVSSRQTNI